MHKVVFDTVVFVRGLINPHGPWGRLVFRHSHQYRLVMSPPVLAEIVEVLTRPELTRKFKSLQQMDIWAVLTILSQADVVELESIPAVSRDPEDDKFLATAKAARAGYLVSADDDLLVLGEYDGIRILSADAFLAILELG